jgi:hypothetical protein
MKTASRSKAMALVCKAAENRLHWEPRVDLSQMHDIQFSLNAFQSERSPIMKKIAFLFAGAMLASAANAQVTVDMSRVTCGEYLAMSPAQSATFSAWMSGWFNQKNGYVFVDLNAYARNVANVKSWCAQNPTQTVMAGLQRATAQ